MTITWKFTWYRFSKTDHCLLFDLRLESQTDFRDLTVKKENLRVYLWDFILKNWHLRLKTLVWDEHFLYRAFQSASLEIARLRCVAIYRWNVLLSQVQAQPEVSAQKRFMIHGLPASQQDSKVQVGGQWPVQWPLASAVATCQCTGHWPLATGH